jgi:hypothetical protein
MFFEPPKGIENGFRFVYMPSEVELNKEKYDKYNPDGFRFAGTVVVPSKTKKEVEKFVAKTLEIDNIEISLGLDIGSCIENTIDKLHEENECSKNCKCNFETERYWGHYVYHLILEAYAKLIGVKKVNLIGYNDDLDMDSLIREKRTTYIEKYEWDDNNKKEIGDFTGSVEYIISVITNVYEQHLKLGNIHELGALVLQDEAPFGDCKKNNCKFENGIPEIIWKSESSISIPDKGYTSDRILPHGLATSNFGRDRDIVNPVASIEKLNCICSSGKNYYRLAKHSFRQDKSKNFNSNTNEIVPNYSDYRNLNLTEEEQIQQLFCDFYSDVLPKKQARVASKLLYDRVLDNKERNSKFLLKNKLDELEKIVSYWPDLERLRDKLKTRKREKKGR